MNNEVTTTHQPLDYSPAPMPVPPAGHPGWPQHLWAGGPCGAPGGSRAPSSPPPAGHSISAASSPLLDLCMQLQLHCRDLQASASPSPGAACVTLMLRSAGIQSKKTKIHGGHVELHSVSINTSCHLVPENIFHPSLHKPRDPPAPITGPFHPVHSAQQNSASWAATNMRRSPVHYTRGLSTAL